MVLLPQLLNPLVMQVLSLLNPLISWLTHNGFQTQEPLLT
jgi:hypothetical protein